MGIDKRVIFYGFLNKCSFVHGNKKITLAPLTPQQVHEDQVSLQKEYEMHARKRKKSWEKRIVLAEKGQEKKGIVHSD